MFQAKTEHLDSRHDFERNLNLLAELMLSERIKFSSKVKNTIEGLKEVRKLPNGRINLHTVNEVARTTANMAARFENIKELSENEKE